MSDLRVHIHVHPSLSQQAALQLHVRVLSLANKPSCDVHASVALTFAADQLPTFDCLLAYETAFSVIGCRKMADLKLHQQMFPKSLQQLPLNTVIKHVNVQHSVVPGNRQQQAAAG